MKQIVKTSEPHELRHWFQAQPLENGRRINCGYNDMPGDVREVVKQQLLAEQGWLCCYTGRRIDGRSSHIEHFKPQSRCLEYEDIDYANLLAAYPGPNAPKCPFGAHEKADWYDAELLINPLKPQCDHAFRFDQSGSIHPAKESDIAARETIRRLCLNHKQLVELREQAIEEALFPEGQTLSKAKLEKIVAGFCNRNGKGQYPAFCFVVAQVAPLVLKKAEQNQTRRLAIHNQSKR